MSTINLRCENLRSELAREHDKSNCRERLMVEQQLAKDRCQVQFHVIDTSKSQFHIINSTKGIYFCLQHSQHSFILFLFIAVPFIHSIYFVSQADLARSEAENSRARMDCVTRIDCEWNLRDRIMPELVNKCKNDPQI